MKLLFSCDLVSNAKKHLQFLQDIHTYNNTTFASSLLITSEDAPTPKEIESLRRYRDLWLPFVLTNSSTGTTILPLIPPPDIAWLWHCHRLAPQEYSMYCETMFRDGIIIDANPPFAFAREVKVEEKNDSAMASRIAQTKDLWNETYPHEGFLLEDVSVNAHSYTHSLLLNGFDLIGSARRQTAFLWQVSGDRYASDTFLKQGVKNYEKFLKLTSKAKGLGIILVPTYQIDLMWHTHILSSITNYNIDCIGIMKSRMYHDDSLTDREEGGVLDTSYNATQKLWKSEYGTEYVVHGGMYRGEPPSTYYTEKWSSCANTDNVSYPIQSSINQALIGKVGASSTSSNLHSSTVTAPKPWVSVNGYAADGSPAFIPLDEPNMSKDKIKKIPFRDNYVLCKINQKVGYCHIDTKEAQEILLERAKDHLSQLETDRMSEMCTCGFSTRNRATSAKEEYKETETVLDTLLEQLTVSVAGGGNTIPSEKLYASAGGACGGEVAIKAKTARREATNKSNLSASPV